ncbi:MAG TPA: hypothetical protein VFI17_06605 [Solirubrobacterales bacterium]|nr:hypothetical protein [Solirubrobacterales bacterium]
MVVGIVAGLFGIGYEALAKPVVSRQGLIETEFDGGFSPKALPKNTPLPISFHILGKIRSLDPEEPHPPALREFQLEGDKHVTVNTGGLPTCAEGKLQATTTEAARKACGPAIIGTGKTVVGVLFPDQNEFDVHSELTAFNGGVRGGVTTLYVHAFLTAPITAAIVTKVKIKKIHKGRYGTLSVASIPKIAGNGAVKSFSLTIEKGVLFATCPDGHLNARGTAVLADGTRIAAGVTRPCTPKG